ncbi:MAG TPA: SLBB domain-containing protein [Rubricoccaceae bacterium]
MGVSVRGTVLSVAAVLVASSGSAQVLPTALPTGGTPGPTLVAPRQPESSSRLALEGPVDANTYVIGPGDVFTVSIGGGVPRQFSATVSADGRLVIPEAGNFAVAGRSLARVRSEVQGELQQRYRNVTADLALSAPREFYVHVAGRVPEPGRVLVPAIGRVEGAVLRATQAPISTLARYGDPTDQPDLRWPALRSIRVERRTGGTVTVDLMRYFATGDLEANPYLQDGDAIYLPAFDPLTEGVVVDGAVDRPGTYDVRPDDTAADLLVVTSGADPSSRIARVRRVRPSTSGASETVEVPFAEAARLDVRARDQIYAVPAAPEADRAEVVGAVRYPGVYPITEGETTVEQLVEMAGGLRDDALLRGAYLERPPQAGSVRPVSESQAGTDESTVAPDVSVEADLLGGLFGRQFFARQTQRTPRVSIDPERVLTGQQAVPLRGGDLLTVPFNSGLVRVYGRVLRSGYVPYVEGATAQDYVAQVGGAGATASGVYVVDAASGQLIEGTDTPVRPGDAVFVNSLPSPDTAEFAQLALQERQDAREDARDRRQSRFQLLQAVLGVTGTIASLVVAYLTVQSVSN